MNSTTWLHSIKLCAIVCIAMLPGCDYGKFKDQPSLRPYEIELPAMPAESLPITGGLQMVREMEGREMQNPISSGPASVQLGAVQYGYFCSMCHGVRADGNGTVGESFHPLPANLRERAVQMQSDGELFYTISFGFNRHPPLAHTVAAPDRWHIINYLRSLPVEHASRDNPTAGN